MKSVEDTNWKTLQFRQNVVNKIEEAIQMAGMPTSKTSREMEVQVFQKAKSRDEYLSFVARLILRVREMNKSIPPAANSAQNIVQNNQNIPDPINALRNLAHQGTGGQTMGAIPQQNSQITASGLLQTLNQRPGFPNKINQPPVSPMQQNQFVRGGPPLTGASPLNNMNMGSPMGNVNIIPTSVPNQMSPSLAPSQNKGPVNTSMPNQMANQMTNQINPAVSSNSQMPNSMSQNAIGSGQIPTQMSQMHQMVQRKVDNIMVQQGPPPGTFIGQRGPMPPNHYIRQNAPSPQQQQPSPASISSVPGNNVLTPSPLVPSPTTMNQLTPGPVTAPGSVRQQAPRMVASPSSGISLNTPAPNQPTPSPNNDDDAYRDKLRQLSKYIDPLRRMIARIGNEDKEKLSKMKKLLEILSTGQRMPLETLLKCEVVLEKLDFKKADGTTAGTSSQGSLPEQHPLLEAVSDLLKSRYANHTLHRTFAPVLEVLNGPPLKGMPRPLKRKTAEDISDDIPEVLQGEIARLDQRFKVSLDPKYPIGCQSIHLLSWLDDKHLPCVPPIQLAVPEDYPSSPPVCTMPKSEYNATEFLRTVQITLQHRISQLSTKCSISQLLDNWEMSVRQACVPRNQPNEDSFLISCFDG